MDMEEKIGVRFPRTELNLSVTELPLNGILPVKSAHYNNSEWWAEVPEIFQSFAGERNTVGPR